MFWSGYKVHQPHFFHPHPSTSEQHSNHPNWRLLLMLHTCWNSWCNTLLSEETEVISSNFVSYSPRFFTILSQTFPFSLIIPTNGSKKVAVHAIRCLVLSLIRTSRPYFLIAGARASDHVAEMLPRVSSSREPKWQACVVTYGCVYGKGEQQVCDLTSVPLPNSTMK